MNTFQYLTVSCVFAFFISSAFAQSAADPKAIDFTAQMDTIAATYSPFEGIYTTVNTRHQNGDKWEDFEIAYNTGSGTSTLRFGGPWIFDTIGTPRIAGEAIQYGDFDGDGIGDVIDHDLKVHNGLTSYPYFDSLGGAYLLFHNFPSSIVLGAIDYDRDGYTDLIDAPTIGTVTNGTATFLSIFRGGPTFKSKESQLFMYPDDSLYIDSLTLWYGAAVTKFGPHLNPEIVFAGKFIIKGKEVHKIGLVHNNVRLSNDTIFYICNNDSDGVNSIDPKNIYVTDITGDGVPDLLVSDGENVYIFKGGDDFGTYELTKDKAYYSIPNPRLIDHTGTFLDVNGFGGYMHALGDLSGSGIPYIMIEASLSDHVGVARAYCMIYAGGKALDSLYDGIMVFDGTSECPLDTLHSIDSLGRSAVAIIHNTDPAFNHGDIDNLLYKGCDSLPHRTNPNLRDAVRSQTFLHNLDLSVFPSVANKYVKLHISSQKSVHTHIVIYDVLGHDVLARNAEIDLGDNIEYFDTRSLVSGKYIAVLTNNDGTEIVSAKFTIER
jgi:hypothetical protein